MGNITTDWPPLTKCGRCGNALPCFSIEWSRLPDDKKCFCASPIYPESPLVVMLKRLFRMK